MKQDHQKDRNAPRHDGLSPLLLHLWPIAIAVALGLVAGPWMFPKASAATPSLSTELSIGGGPLHVAIKINLN